MHQIVEKRTGREVEGVKRVRKSVGCGEKNYSFQFGFISFRSVAVLWEESKAFGPFEN